MQEMTQQNSDTIPMNDMQAEQSVLGAILIDPGCMDEITFLEPRDFGLKRHELIFGVMRYLRDRDVPVDLVTVAEHFQKRGRFEDLGGISYVSELATACPTAANVQHYAQIVRSRAHRRRGIELSNVIVEIANGDHEDDDAYFAAIDEAVTQMRPTEATAMRSFADARKRYFEHLKSKAEKMLTGFKQFDDWASLWRGWLYILAGRPSVGKTAKALQMGHGIATLNPGAGCLLIFSQEMDETEVIDRMVANVAGVNYNRLINKGGDEGFTENEWKKINETYEKLEKLPIYIQDASGISIEDIEATARTFIKKHGKIAAIIVDYLQIMSIPEKKGITRSQAIGKVTVRAKHLARKYKFCFILLSQMTRESENREEPKLSDLKESGNIEQDADVVEFLWTNGDKDNGSKVVQSIFAKGRNVGMNRFRYRFEGYLQRYVELDQKDGDKGGGSTNSKRGAAKKGGSTPKES